MTITNESAAIDSSKVTIDKRITDTRRAFDIFYATYGPSLGNYFVTVHEIMRFIEECPEDIDLTIYARLFRTQLASWEVMLIAYYCIADQQLSPTMTKLVNDYALLHFLEPAAYQTIEESKHFDSAAFDYA